VLLVGLPFVHGVPTTADLLWGAGAGATGSVSAALIYRALAIGPGQHRLTGVVRDRTRVPRAGRLCCSASARARSRSPVSRSPRSRFVLLAQVGEEHLPVLPPGGEGASDAMDPHAAPDAGSTPATSAATASHRIRRVLIASISAGLGAGLFLVLIGRVQQGSGLWPLIGARVVAIVLLAAWLLARGRSIAPPLGTRRLSLAAGAFDSFANVSFVWAVQRGSLALVAALVSLSPATAVLLARGILHERWSVPQRIGLGVALLSGVLISIG
jgi:uncharacterized membrane protein